MKTNHLLASVAFTAVLIVTLPAHAQLLGGGMHGGVTSMQAATFGGGIGTPGSAASGRTDASDSARAGGRVPGVGRVDRTARAAEQESGHDVRGTKTDAAVADRRSVATGDAAVGTTRAAAGTAAATGVSAAGQGEAQARNVDAAGAAAGGLAVTEEPRTKAKADSSKPSTSQPARTSKPDSPRTPRHSSPTGNEPTGNDGKTPRSAGPHGGTNADVSADASASASASATH
jgi:hypothetical protein